MAAIGIDLGTTFSCVAVRKDGIVEVFKNDSGNLVTPSCVCFTKGQTLIGDPAKNLKVEEPENTIFSIKRIIGRKFDDPTTQEDKKKWPFILVRSSCGRPQVKIVHSRKTYYAEEISGLVLDYMRRIAYRKLDKDVRDAVVTVPAYFNHMQRSATKTAAELAGLNVLRIINEPTAAAIAFGLEKRYSENHNIMVYDLGGGTFDVTVLSIKGSEFIVKASSGNSHLGGDDFTNRIVDHFVKHLRDNMGKDIKGNKRAESKLWTECEKAKKELSYRSEYKVCVENIADRVTLNKSITRANFQSLNKDLLDQTMEYVEDAIKESGMEKEDINFVVPVGGSSRIPYVIEMLQNYFGEGIVKDDKAPDEAIAKGAAIYAAFLKGETLQEISEIDLSEVTPLSLGIRLQNKTTNIIIRRNTKIPVTQRKEHENSKDGQKVIIIHKEKLDNIVEEIKRYNDVQEERNSLELILDEIKGRDNQDQQVIEQCKEIANWLQQNENATISEIQHKKAEIKELESGYRDTTVRNVQVCRSTKKFYEENFKSSNVYPMHEGRLKGKVLIINNKFLGQKHMERHGSQVDVRNLQNLWKQVGFEVVTKENLGGGDMRCLCDDFAKESFDINVLVLIVMSHGGIENGKEMISGEDNEKVLTEQIISCFTSKNAPRLQGIPKVLMFQACRGEDRDHILMQSSFESDAKPDRSDMLIVYPTQSGYVSFRNREKGSWLMNAVTRVFMRKAKDTHVLDMLTEVNHEISLKGNNSNKQMSIQHTTLTKKLFLFPGWPS